MAALLATVASIRSLQAQAPGTGWAVAPAPPRAIKQLYWELFNVTEVWTRIVPRLADDASKHRSTRLDAQQIPVSVIFSASLPGKDVGRARAPREITILAQADPLAYLPVPSFSLLFSASEGRVFDFVRAADPIFPCDTCASNALLAHVQTDVFVALMRAEPIHCDVLGFRCEIDDADRRAIAEFARTIKLSN
jgi:hypothetical protein